MRCVWRKYITHGDKITGWFLFPWERVTMVSKGGGCIRKMRVISAQTVSTKLVEAYGCSRDFFMWHVDCYFSPFTFFGLILPSVRVLTSNWPWTCVCVCVLYSGHFNHASTVVYPAWPFRFAPLLHFQGIENLAERERGKNFSSEARQSCK